MREDWQVEEIGKLFHTTSGGTPSRKNSTYYNGDIPWVKSGELDRGIIYNTEEKITEEAVENSSAKLFPKKTLLIALYGATIGKLAFLGIEAATNQAICGIFENENIDSKYLYHYLFFRRPKLISQGTGGAQPNISQTILKKLKFPLAPLPIQRAIVTKIENLFASLDKGIADLKKAQEQLKIYRQAVLKKAFEGEWVHPEVLSQDSDYEKKRDKSSGDLPKDWKWVKLCDVCEHITDGDHQAPPKSNSGIPFITISNIEKSNNKINFSNTFYVSSDYFKNLNQRRVPRKGDILYTVTGSFGIPVMIDFSKDFCFQRHIGLIRPISDVNQKWLFYLLQTQLVYGQASEKATGTAQKTVALSVLRNIQIPFCSEEEQHQIVKEIESRLSVCDKIEQNIIEALERSEALRQSILKKAFEGKLLSKDEIEKCKQEADYEPASELLKKIKAEKNRK